LKKSDVFLRELQELKAGMNLNEESLSNDSKVIILERKQKELKRKSAQVQDEIEREIEDFFGYLNIKQASIETLSDMNAYIEGELRKVEQLIEKFKATKD
jgi:hypothetical protein